MDEKVEVRRDFAKVEVSGLRTRRERIRVRGLARDARARSGTHFTNSPTRAPHASIRTKRPQPHRDPHFLADNSHGKSS